MSNNIFFVYEMYVFAMWTPFVVKKLAERETVMI